MLRKILIVDDVELNRQVLRKILSQDYELLEAENGKEALAILDRSHDELSAVLLDILMPEMDGYAVLEQMRSDPRLKQLPVIVTTGNMDADAENKAFASGANDFITKPYNPTTIKQRLWNIINLRETSATVNALQRDALTGLYNRETFIRKAEELINAHGPGHYVLACFDINNFKVVNDRYGSAKGDQVLRHVASVFQKGFESAGGLAGRIMADNFAVLYPASLLHSAGLVRIREEAAMADRSLPPVSFTIGRYVVDDLSLTVSAMYDRAALAAASIKGRFDVNIAFYDESMRQRLLYEQEIVNEMEQALAAGQFEAWLQPQYNHASGALIGAEALARWRHPAKGLIPPGDFIPVFEANGFVYELDKYIWEQACLLLRRWLDGSRAPLPISVNVSRLDLFRPDLVDVLIGLVDKYRIPIDLLRLEITESAFARSEGIVNIVKSLIAQGFTVEIDDFGSGYSSLNTLKDVPAQVLKMDMRFLESDRGSGRGGNILESIVRMAKWLDMSVIAEGVEGIEQADYLKSIGCNYVQGYLYAKPMPADEYEALADKATREEKLLSLVTVDNLDNNTFWDPNSMDTLIFNSYVGGACIFEYHKGNIELLRATEKYARMLGGGLTIEDALRLNWTRHLDEENRKRVNWAIQQSINAKDEVTSEYVFLDLPGCPRETHLRSTIRVIAAVGDRYLIYCTNENITAQRQAEQKERDISQRMQAIMDNINGGVTAVTLEEGGGVRFVFANEQYYALLGYTKEQYETELASTFDRILPEDRDRVAQAVQKVSASQKPASIVYRALRRDGRMIWIQHNISVTSLPGVETPVQLAVANDITAQVEAERKVRSLAQRMQAVMDNVGSGIAAVILHDHEVEYLFCNDRYFEIHGYTREQYQEEVTDVYQLIHAEDRQRVYQAAREANQIGATATLEYRVTRRDGQEAWQRLIISTRRFAGVKHPVQFSVITDITAEKMADERIRALNETLQNMMNDMPGGFARLRVAENGSMSVVFANENLCRMRGLPYDQLDLDSPGNASHTIHPDDMELVRASVAQMMATGQTCNIQYRLKRVDDTFIPVNVFGRISKNESGEIFVNAYYTDLTQREKESLSQRETLPYVLSAIMRSSTELAFAKDKDFRYICCSRAFVEHVGLADESDVIGKTDYDLYDQATADRYRRDDMRLFASGEVMVNYQEPLPTASGGFRYAVTSKYLLQDTLGNIMGLYGVGRDITQERVAFEQLKLLTNSIPGGLATYICSPEEIRLTYFNDGFCRILGYTHEEYEQIASRSITSLTFKEDVPLVLEQIEALLRQDVSLDCTCRVHTKDGGFKWVNLRGEIAQRQGDICTVNAVLYDVTQSRLAQEAALVHQQEMRLAMSVMGKMLCEYDPAARVLTVSDAYAALYGLESGSIPNVPDSILAAGFIEPDSVDQYQAFYDAIFRGEKSGSMEYRERRSDGSVHWERAEFSLIWDSDGQPVKAIIAVEDTTEQHLRYELEQSRPRLGEANLMVHALFDLTSGQTLEYLYRDGREVPLDDRTALHYGQDLLDELLIDEEERRQYRELNDIAGLLAKFSQGQTEHILDYRRRVPGGDIIWVRNIKHLVGQPGGDHVLLFDYFYNIEEEKTQEQLYSTLVNENYEYAARINGRNRHFVMLLGEDLRDPLIPERGEDFDQAAAAIVKARAHPDDRDGVLEKVRVDKMKENLSRSGRFQFTFRIIMPDGSVRYKRISQFFLDRARDIIIFAREDITASVLEETRKSQLLEEALAAANEENRVHALESAARLRAIMNNVDGGMTAATLIDGQIDYLHINDQYYALLGYTKEQFDQELERGIFQCIHPDDLPLVYAGVEESERTGKARIEFRVYRRDGSLRWMRSVNSTCAIAGVAAPVHIGVLMDITGEKEAADALRISEEQFRIAAAIGGGAIARYDIRSGVYYHQDRELLAMGFADTIENVPQSIIDKGNVAPDSIPEYLEFYEKIRRGEQSCSVEASFLMQDGSFRWHRQEATIIFDAAGRPSQAILATSDITEQRQKEAAYRELAETDPLTGVLNRAAFSQAAEALMKEQARSGGSLALLMLDIDGFKLINDTYGHAAGDKVLTDMAGSLRGSLRHGDILGRLGGDEFLIGLPGMPGDESIAKKAAQICSLLHQEKEGEISISVSIGVAVCPRDGQDFETLYHKMDAALYAVKGQGKNNYAFYRDSMARDYEPKSPSIPG